MPSQKCGKKVSKKTENTSLLVVKDHYLLRGSRIIILEKLCAKELKIILLIYFLILKYLGIRSTWLRVKWLGTVTYVASIIKLLIMCFISIRSFFSWVKLNLLCFLFVILKLKQQSIFFKNAQLLKVFGINFSYWDRSWPSLFNNAGSPFWITT